ncbi:hypothetical protein [Acidisoma sp. 7E03]
MMDGDGSAGAPEEGGPKDWVAELRRQTEEIRKAGDEWAIRWQEPEGRFVSALLGAIEIVGRLTVTVQTSIDASARDSRAAAEAELAKARALQQAAQITLLQARNLELAATAEQENLTVRMIDQTLPLFIERLEKVLVIRERAWNQRVTLRRYGIAAAATLGIFVAGFGLSWWQDASRLAAIEACWMNPFSAAGHTYCRIDALPGGKAPK